MWVLNDWERLFIVFVGSLRYIGIFMVTCGLFRVLQGYLAAYYGNYGYLRDIYDNQGGFTLTRHKFSTTSLTRRQIVNLGWGI